MNIFDSAIGLVAPPICIGCGSEGDSLCWPCSLSVIVPYGPRCFDCGALTKDGRPCGKCQKTGTPYQVFVCTNYEGAAKELIRLYKYAHQRVAAKSLARLMFQTVQHFNLPAKLRFINYLVLPVPTATRRQRLRGFDHSGLLAKQLARLMGCDWANGLRRIGQSQQVGARRSLRAAQAEGNYEVRLQEVIRGRNILLVDDVVTTGATIRAATKVLRAAGARQIDALVFAKKL